MNHFTAPSAPWPSFHHIVLSNIESRASVFCMNEDLVPIRDTVLFLGCGPFHEPTIPVRAYWADEPKLRFCNAIYGQHRDHRWNTSSARRILVSNNTHYVRVQLYNQRCSTRPEFHIRWRPSLLSYRGICSEETPTNPILHLLQPGLPRFRLVIIKLCIDSLRYSHLRVYALVNVLPSSFILNILNRSLPFY